MIILEIIWCNMIVWQIAVLAATPVRASVAAMRQLSSKAEGHATMVAIRQLGSKFEGRAAIADVNLTDCKGEYIFEFGKHQGKSIKQVPHEYLEWIVRERVYLGKPHLIEALKSLKQLKFVETDIQSSATSATRAPHKAKINLELVSLSRIELECPYSLLTANAALSRALTQIPHAYFDSGSRRWSFPLQSHGAVLACLRENGVRAGPGAPSAPSDVYYETVPESLVRGLAEVLPQRALESAAAAGASARLEAVWAT